MKTHTVVSLLLCILALSACHAPSVPDHMKTRVLLQDEFSQRYLEVNVNEFTDARGQLGVQATIVNKTQNEVGVQYRFQWFTEDGQFVDSPGAAWIPIKLKSGDSYIAQSSAVTDKTVRPRMSVRKWE